MSTPAFAAYSPEHNEIVGPIRSTREAVEAWIAQAPDSTLKAGVVVIETGQRPSAPAVGWTDEVDVYFAGVTWIADAKMVLTDKVEGQMPLVRLIERWQLVEGQWALHTELTIEILSPPEDLATPKEAYAMAEAIRGAGEQLALILARQVIVDAGELGQG